MARITQEVAPDDAWPPVDLTEGAQSYSRDPDVEAGRRAMRDADRAYEMTLASLRNAFGLTQVEMARALGVSQAAVSETERRGDLLVSTLVGYLAALGLHPRIVVRFPERGEVEVGLDALASGPG